MDAVYRLLDAQLVDVEGRRCGRVDDLELDGEPLAVTAILSGRGTYADRLPPRLRRLALRVFGEDVRGRTVRRVPWEEVDEVTDHITLRRKAADLGLGEGDR
jgi:sporulation protein YlmC with PRC-barrel domain